MGKRYVSFSLAGGRYCVPVDQVLQIVRLENLLPIPKPPPYVEGVINIRGEIIPVINLRQRLEIVPSDKDDARDPDARKRRLIVTRVGSRSYGLGVDEVQEILDITESDISPDATTLFGMRADFILGIARREESLYIMLDLPRIFSAGHEVPGVSSGRV